MYLHSLPATSSSFAASPVFLALPFPSLLGLSSPSPLIPFAFGSPSLLAVCDGREKEHEARNLKKKKRIKHDGLLSGVNYARAQDVKGTGNWKAQQTSLSRLIKVRRSL